MCCISRRCPGRLDNGERGTWNGWEHHRLPVTALASLLQYSCLTTYVRRVNNEELTNVPYAIRDGGSSLFKNGHMENDFEEHSGLATQ